MLVTVRTVVIPLPSEVVAWLREEGRLVLPRECDSEAYEGREEEYEQFGEVDWEAGHSDEEPSEQRSFPEFSARVRDVMARLGGAVFVKLNWSSPKDATWVTLNNSLKCTSLSQILLLLKSSDFITHDLSFPFSDCEDAETAETEVGPLDWLAVGW